MFSIGDVVFYNAHGVCSIEDIQEQKFGAETKLYYVLRSHHSTSVTLYHPADSAKCKLKKMMTADYAQQVLEMFEQPAVQWAERNTDRNNYYQATLHTENHLKIAEMVNTLMRRRDEMQEQGKKLPSQDQQMLQRILPILQEEVSIALSLTQQQVLDIIEDKITQYA